MEGITMKPEIIVTTRDFERLIALIDSLPPTEHCEELLNELGRAELVDGDEVPPLVVTMNSTVRFTLGREGEEFCMTLVYPREAGDHTISVLSPVGSALLGLAVGSSIEWRGPNGAPLLVKVLDVVYQPERDGVTAA
jgi:regulator of nucleoside diphosphate kinase